MKKILIVADVKGWAFHNHAIELQTRLSDEFDIDIGYYWEKRTFDYHKYDLTYFMDYLVICDGCPKDRAVSGSRCEFSYRNVGITRFMDTIRAKSKAMHVVSQSMLDHFKSFKFPIEYITHGVNVSLFNGSLDDISGNLKIGWSGNPVSQGHKGIEIINAIGSLPGIEVKMMHQQYNGATPLHLTRDRMAEFYRSIHVYVCASESEGNNNPLLEAAACGRAIISTRTGTAPEYIKHGINGYLVDRNYDDISKAVLSLRDDRSKLQLFGNAIKDVIQINWSWDKMANNYRSWFRRMM